MILRGHIPLQRHGKSRDINKDTHLLLQCFIPRDKALNKASLTSACRTLHLVFKGMTADEVFDQLMLCMVKSVRKYDPFFHEKIKTVVGIIESDDFHEKKFFTAAHVTRHLGYDAACYVRYLAKRLFLVAGQQAVGAEVQFRRSDTWPPPPPFFQTGSVGLSYFASKWFRYYLVDYIHFRMGELESKEGVLQLYHDQEQDNYSIDGPIYTDRGLCHTQGNFVNPRTGRAAAVDLTLVKSPQDVGKLNLDWVHNTQKHLFLDLSKRERHLLYCLYARDMDWDGIASTFNLSMRDAKRWHQAVLEKIQEKVKGDALDEVGEEVAIEIIQDLVAEEIPG
jgi:hypothetical protein